VTDRSEIRSLLQELYAARVRGDHEGLCRIFSTEATLRIAGVSLHVSPIAITAVGIDEIRQWMTLLIKTFRVIDQVIFAMIIENDQAAVHWRSKIYSRITGTAVPTELVDLVGVRDGHVISFIEFLAPCR
jgi:ketosteroid isomerase-like protein